MIQLNKSGNGQGDVTVLWFIVSKSVINWRWTWDYIHFYCVVRLSIGLQDNDLDLSLFDNFWRTGNVRVDRLFTDWHEFKEKFYLIIWFQNNVACWSHNIISRGSLAFSSSNPMSPLRLISNKLELFLLEISFIWIVNMHCKHLILVKWIVYRDLEELQLPW